MKFQVMEAVELAPGAEANIEVVCNVRNEMGLWTMSISKDEIVGRSSSLWDGIEINGGDEKREGAIPFACSGDGSPTVVIRIKNVTENGIRIDKKNIIGQGKVIRDAVHATADPCTMELMRVKEKDPEEREVEEEGVEKVHVFNRSTWLQLFEQKVDLVWRTWGSRTRAQASTGCVWAGVHSSVSSGNGHRDGYH
mgnify:CR=1 FL=1